MIPDQECYDRHPGLVALQIGTETSGAKDGSIVVGTRYREPFTPAECRAEVRRLLADRDVVSVSVFSMRESQHFITYTRKNFDALTTDDGRMDVASPEPEAPRVPARVESVPSVRDGAGDRRAAPDAARRAVAAVRGLSTRERRYAPKDGPADGPALTGNLAALRAAYAGGKTRAEALATAAWVKPLTKPREFVNNFTNTLMKRGLLVEVKEA